MGQMAVDTVLSAPYPPISFLYDELGPLGHAFAPDTILFAVAADMVLRARTQNAQEGGSHA